MELITLLKELSTDKSLVRILLNAHLKELRLEGRVLDVGGGRQDYLDFMDQSGIAEMCNTDIRESEERPIDLEKEPLPYSDGYFDEVLMLNFLEHVFDHNYVVGEVHRVMKSGSTLHGFVPFLINVHPHPHDYFRYTNEALERILKNHGFTDIQVAEYGGGPFYANFNNLVLSVPVPIRLIMFPFYYLLDMLMVKLRPNIIKRYPLGYLFTAKK